ncbi:MAG: CHAT domain-containing protein [Armatimonadetes bacterium]|nr:CHAT domain-containing protein [Armatimonadota bacterium]
MHLRCAIFILLLALAWPCRAQESPEVIQRKLAGLRDLRKRIAERLDSLQQRLWFDRLGFASQIGDNNAVEAALQHFDREFSGLSSMMLEALDRGEALEQAGVDVSGLGSFPRWARREKRPNYDLIEWSQGEGRQWLEEERRKTRVAILRLELQKGVHSQVLREGETLLAQLGSPLSAEPRTWNQLLDCLAAASLETGQPARAAAYIDKMTDEDPSFDWYNGARQLSLDVERNPNLSDQQFLRSFEAQWPRLRRSAEESGDVAQAAGNLIWLSARMARRGSRGTLESVQQRAMTDLEKLGLAHWNRPVLEVDVLFEEEYLNRSWDASLFFAMLDARLRLAGEAREAGDYRRAREQLVEVKAFFPSMEQKAKELEPLARQLFAGSEVVPDMRRGYFSSIPAHYYEELGRLTEAEEDAADPVKVKGYLDQALALYERSGHSEGAILGLMPHYALVAHRAGGPAPASLAMVEKTLKTSRERGLRRIAIQAQLARGELQARAGERSAAIADLQAGLAMLEEFVTELGGDAPAAVSQKEQARPSYELLARLQADSGQTQEAFAVLDRMQQVAFSGNVLASGAEDPRVAEALEQVRESQLRLRSLEHEGEALRTSVPESIRQQALEPHETMIEEARKDFYAQVSELSRLDSGAYDRLAIRPGNLLEVQRSIPANTLVAQYLPTETELYLFVADQDTMKTVRFPVTRAQLSKLTRDFRRAILSPPDQEEATREFQTTAFELYRCLIEPLEKDLEGKQVLAVIPTGDLLYIPFGALARPRAGGGLEYLLERLQTVSLVKSKDLDRLDYPVAGKSDGQVVAFGDPDGTLAAALSEVQAIRNLFPDAVVFVEGQATKAALSSVRAEDVSYVHFATHGVLDTRDPGSNHLVMAGGEAGRLTVNEIAALRLGHNVRLVTLSACQTALGDANPRSELLQSMADAFGRAGSPSVVASLWKVADDSTRELMEEFYRGLKSGQPRSLALQRAALKLVGQERYRHPFYWAPFVLLGDWR